jgi:hypothetical protein
VIRKRGGCLQVQVFAGRDPLTGRKRWLSRQGPPPYQGCAAPPASELRERGHDVVAPDLPSEDASAGLAEYADAVVDVIGDRGDLVVVAQVGRRASCNQLTGRTVIGRNVVMTKVFSALAVSVDGYITGPHPGPEQPLGVGGARLFDWYTNGDTPSRIFEGFRLCPASAAVFDAAAERVGAVISGRRPMTIRVAGTVAGRTRLRRCSCCLTGRRPGRRSARMGRSSSPPGSPTRSAWPGRPLRRPGRTSA